MFYGGGTVAMSTIHLSTWRRRLLMRAFAQGLNPGCIVFRNDALNIFHPNLNQPWPHSR